MSMYDELGQDDEEQLNIKPILDFIRDNWLVVVLVILLLIMMLASYWEISNCNIYYQNVLKEYIFLNDTIITP
jgi:hypothetical protein